MQTEKNLLLGNVFAERRGTLLVPVQSPLPQRERERVRGLNPDGSEQQVPPKMEGHAARAR